MKAVCYNLELKSPVLATDLEGEPNSAVSLPYISGALLRGALVGRYLKTEPEFDAADTEARALFLGDNTRFLNAYPVKDGKRALPTPLAWRHDKNDDYEQGKDLREINNMSRITPEDIEKRKAGDQGFLAHGSYKEEAVEGRFVWIESEKSEIAPLFSPTRQLNVHTQRDARFGRATGEAGTIYRYNALAAGLQLRGVILTTDDGAGQFEKLLRGATLSIGRARNAGYGEVLVKEVEILDYWRETETYESAGEINAGDQLQITFTSDALLRDENGQSTLNARTAIAARLGVLPTSLTLLPIFTRISSKVVGGFNRKWALPLPQAIAIAAGSVFTYETAGQLRLEAVDELEQKGIGERRNEGFGRLLINWHLGPLYQTKRVEAKEVEFLETGQLEALSNDEQAMAERIAERLLRRRLDEELRKRVNYTKIKSPPGKSQLSRLRVVLRDIQNEIAHGRPGALDRLDQYLKNLDNREAGKQFRVARVIYGSVSHELLAWLPEQVRSAKDKWSSETIKFGSGKAVIEAAPDNNLALEYALRLMDQVLYRVTKEQK